MANVEFSLLSVLFIVVINILFPDVALGEPRSEIIQITCGNQLPQNTSAAISNYVAATERIRQQIETQDYGQAVSGDGPDAIYGLVQCYGDLSLIDCALCSSVARTSVSECFPFVGGKIFLDGCFMRVGNTSFFNEYVGSEDRAVCGNKTRKNLAFQETVRQAVLRASSNAAKDGRYARVEIPVSGAFNESAYVLANCWNKLSVNSCRACLDNASTSIQGCLPWSEGRALNTGCFMRYSDTNFLNDIPNNGSSRGSSTVIIAVVVSSTVVVAAIAAIVVYIWKEKRIDKKRKGVYDPKKMAKILRDSSLNFKYSILAKATCGFNEANKIGQGGFGTVYKVVILTQGVLPDGREIAVKRLFLNNLHNAAEFYNEVNIISSIEHKNLVRLLGCSCSDFDSLLVYEFLPNKSLDRFLFGEYGTPFQDCNNEGKTLNWEERFAIITGTAEGLIYLHENPKIRIIHRDIKASNILLNTRLHAKIADFGLARSFQEDKTHISTVIAGTLGYMAPEYLSQGKLTEKADVYSFGVLLLEIVTGRRNNESKTLEEYSKGLICIVWEHFLKGTVEDLIDPNLMLKDSNASVKNEGRRVIHVGLLCIQETPLLRPSMSEALQMLIKKDENLPPPHNPPFIDVKTMEFNDSIATISQSTFYPR